MTSLDLVKLITLMDITRGSPNVTIGLIDGPVYMRHPDFAGQAIHDISDYKSEVSNHINNIAYSHGTFVAGILSAKRDSDAPAICPDCKLVLRPIFTTANTKNSQLPSATPNELATAIEECIKAGARCINLSLALAQPSSKNEDVLEQVLNYAAKQGVAIIAAAGNQGTLGSTTITRHPWVISVVACDLNGRPSNTTNLGNSIGKRGIRAPGKSITSLGTEGMSITLGGTSAATPFVTGTIALLMSIFPNATAFDIKTAVMQANHVNRNTVVPPLLDAWSAYQYLATSKRGQSVYGQ